MTDQWCIVRTGDMSRDWGFAQVVYGPFDSEAVANDVAAALPENDRHHKRPLGLAYSYWVVRLEPR